MAGVRLSEEMQRALDLARNGGGRLYRWPGGFWRATAVGEAIREIHHVTLGTIRALERRGLLRRTNIYREEYRDTREVVEDRTPVLDD